MVPVGFILRPTGISYFNHRNVINYCNRPYKDVEEMNEALVKIWNSKIRKKDIVYFLGDFSLNPKVMTRFITKLNGYKILISGNHDATFPKHQKHNRMIKIYLENGWNEIYFQTNIMLKNGQEILLAHLPYANEEGNKFDQRYLSYKPKDEGLVLIHGHLHSRYRKLGRMIDVGIDGDWKIFSENDIINLINDERNFIPTPLTEYYNTLKQRDNMEGMDL